MPDVMRMVEILLHVCQVIITHHAQVVLKGRYGSAMVFRTTASSGCKIWNENPETLDDSHANSSTIGSKALK
jgi:hypothetical protein